MKKLFLILILITTSIQAQREPKGLLGYDPYLIDETFYVQYCGGHDNPTAKISLKGGIITMDILNTACGYGKTQLVFKSTEICSYDREEGVYLIDFVNEDGFDDADAILITKNDIVLIDAKHFGHTTLQMGIWDK